MKKLNYLFSICILFVCIITSCKNKNRNATQQLQGNWFKIDKTSNGYQQTDCGDGIETIQVKSDSLIHKGLMEEVSLKIDHIETHGDTTSVYIDPAEISYYRLIRFDQKNGLAKWIVREGEGATTEKVFVDESNLSKIKKVVGTSADCGANADDRFAIGDSGMYAIIEGENCIAINDKNDKIQLERCLDEGNIIKFRQVKGNFLPLTFINGPHAMDADFFFDGTAWLTQTITFYKHSPDGHLKTTRDMRISLADFDFGTVAEKLEK